mmetsp:Transcript_17449/g.60941  ORF Transcript_17449/g.60941 Transcript_17449/m.60941 type:complete len:532 (+) Transcript_17449:375-1970(+)
MQHQGEPPAACRLRADEGRRARELKAARIPADAHAQPKERRQRCGVSLEVFAGTAAACRATGGVVGGIVARHGVALAQPQPALGPRPTTHCRRRQPRRRRRERRRRRGKRRHRREAARRERPEAEGVDSRHDVVDGSTGEVQLPDWTEVLLGLHELLSQQGRQQGCGPLLAHLDVRPLRLRTRRQHGAYLIQKGHAGGISRVKLPRKDQRLMRPDVRQKMHLALSQGRWTACRKVRVALRGLIQKVALCVMEVEVVPDVGGAERRVHRQAVEKGFVRGCEEDDLSEHLLCNWEGLVFAPPAEQRCHVERPLSEELSSLHGNLREVPEEHHELRAAAQGRPRRQRNALLVPTHSDGMHSARTLHGDLARLALEHLGVDETQSPIQRQEVLQECRRPDKLVAVGEHQEVLPLGGQSHQLPKPEQLSRQQRCARPLDVHLAAHMDIAPGRRYATGAGCPRSELIGEGGLRLRIHVQQKRVPRIPEVGHQALHETRQALVEDEDQEAQWDVLRLPVLCVQRIPRRQVPLHWVARR